MGSGDKMAQRMDQFWAGYISAAPTFTGLTLYLGGIDTVAGLGLITVGLLMTTVIGIFEYFVRED